MMLYKSKCLECGTCKKVCPHNLEACDLCGTCTKYCPTGAKKVCGRIWAFDEVMAEIEKDIPFYKASGGGVTFSGGECMLQVDFLKTLLEECKREGIHTAVDTAGNIDFEAFEKIISSTDLFLYDLKCFTEELHYDGTGVSNKRILENLKKLSEISQVIVRIPIISGFNTDTAELEKMADFLKSVKCQGVELLPYHRLGENKYRALGMKSESFCVPSKEKMEKIEKTIKNK
jgi:pyruvate formate lyase activating enzyme